jgi:ABC-type multidrug transport system fused ATPase/permease subunit
MMKQVTTVLSPFRRLFKILPGSSRGGLVLVVCVSLIAAFFETASVASILPFMAIVMDPDVLDKYPWFDTGLKFFGIESKQTAIIVIGFATVAVLALGNAASATNLWVSSKYVALTRRKLSTELFEGYMAQPYAFHVQRDAASLNKVLGGDVDAALNGFLGSLLAVISKGLTGLVLVGMIVIFDPFVALGSVVILGGGYFLVYRLIRAKQAKLGREMNEAAILSGRTTIEALGGIKELRVLGREHAALETYTGVLKILVNSHISNLLSASLPRYVIEVIAYGGIVAVTLVFVVKGQALEAVPSLALYALAGNRLVPTFQQFFASALSIKYYSLSVASLETDLAIVRSGHTQNLEKTTKYFSKQMAFNNEIRLQDLSFTYPSSQKPALDNISLVIGQKQSIGIVGRTGSGKTTLVDIILGLYRPGKGALTVDGVVVDINNDRAWRSRIGYVPQSVFLINASIKQNIALGIPREHIDQNAIEQSARMAQAEEFISQLPLGYETVVGERGVKLSGGQRQRLGIARALYHDPDILIFDEATSALDGMTEDAVMEAVQRLSGQRTMILIAHRLRTVQSTDRIIMLEAGKIVADGSYEDLLAHSLPFKKLSGQRDSVTAQI